MLQDLSRSLDQADLSVSTLFSIEVSVTKEGTPGPGEGHHGKGNWYRDVDSDL